MTPASPPCPMTHRRRVGLRMMATGLMTTLLHRQAQSNLECC
jgi:hypothetical protein